MRPKLKIGPLTQLQDARSSAAVGFDVLSFSLERGSMKKLAPNTVWNIVNWIQGPEILLELNKDSLIELEEMNKSFQASWLSLPLEDWDPSFLPQLAENIVLISDDEVELEKLKLIQEEISQAGKSCFFEIYFKESGKISTYQELEKSCYFHFSEAEKLFHFVKHSRSLPYGFSLGEEFREDAEYLDYELIDEWIELVEDTYPQD